MEKKEANKLKFRDDGLHRVLACGGRAANKKFTMEYSRLLPIFF